ncbi:MAG TPA: helicase C-terminal domain-containing protein [Candidatus Nitrosocosmicus sp.]|nr:helicase C-terminal domain-containing protein [Candidatus Nitrosocosmicus sp.]
MLKDISDAFNSGYRYVILEAPTGFGKSAVAITLALSLGSSYICTSTKDLQTQYSNDFPYVKAAKGKNNFPCLLKQDFVDNGTYQCGTCAFSNSNECYHTTVEYGHCMTNEFFKEDGCKYRTFAKDYTRLNERTKDEKIYIDNDTKQHYQKQYAEWLPISQLKVQREWQPCEYFNQLNIALAASHSIFNYSNFLAFLPYNKRLSERELLVLDEGHLLETEIVKFRGLSISKKRWKRYIGDFDIVDYGYDSIERWIDFLIDLETKMLSAIGNNSLASVLDIERNIKFDYYTLRKISSKDLEPKKRIVSATELFESDEEIAKKYASVEITSKNDSKTLDDELAVDALKDTERLTRTINSILANPKNWIISDIKKDNYKIEKVELKPLDISPYCKSVFDKGSKTLIMSATILNNKAFCKSIGLDSEDIKFIQVESDFPIEHRAIYPLNIAYLNYSNLQSIDVMSKISVVVDNLMTTHRNEKGIIHTTSYEQLNFIKENLSKDNARRLLITDPEIQRDEIISQHSSTPKPTVLISPSLHTGLDLKDELSRFQIITKVPYPNKSDRWTNAKRVADEEWYYWQTALRLIQAYGRSVRSKNDWARTYVLDSAFSYFIRKNRNILPSWFIQAIKGYSR